MPNTHMQMRAHTLLRHEIRAVGDGKELASARPRAAEPQSPDGIATRRQEGGDTIIFVSVNSYLRFPLSGTYGKSG